MSDEPLYCTWCGAEDWDCDCRKDRAGTAFCEVDYTHEWTEEDTDKGWARCRWCGLRASVHEPTDGGLRVVRLEKGPTF